MHKGDKGMEHGDHKAGKDSFLSQMIGLVEEAQQSKSRSQDLANRAALWLTVIALSCGAITLMIWLGIMGRDFAFSLERMVTVMVGPVSAGVQVLLSFSCLRRSDF